MNRSLYTGIANIARSAGLLRLGERRFRGGTFVMMLHRVLPKAELSDCYNPHLALTTDALDSFLREIQQIGRLISLKDAVTRIQGKPNDSATCFAITFDDGWEDNHRCAFPILRAHDAPATIFLVTGAIGTDKVLPEERLWRVWRAAEKTGRIAVVRNRLEPLARGADTFYQVHQAMKKVSFVKKDETLSALELTLEVDPPKRRFLTWEEASEMSPHGIEFGAHTVSHAVLTAESAEAAMQELTESRRAIERRIGRSCWHFAYPNGYYNEAAEHAVRDAGFTAAFATTPVMARAGDGTFRIPRVPLDNTVVSSGSGEFSAAGCRLFLVQSAAGSAAEHEY